MFIPRAVRLKNTTSTGKKSTAHTKPINKNARNSGLESGAASSGIDSKHAPPVDDHKDTNPTIAKPPSLPTLKPDYVGQLLHGVELIFTDYAHQDPGGANWLQTHYRVVDGEEHYIHLSSVLEHPNISSLKPAATQPTLIRALQGRNPKSLLEVSENGYYIRRQPSSYPLRFIPKDSFQITNDDGLGFWDERTIYIEPHTRDLCKIPAKVAWWLEQHGEVREKWLPIQHVQTIYNSCAFVVLSGNVHHAGVWKKWIDKNKPEDWKILTKVEHTQRTNEYLKLLQHDNPKMLEKNQKSQLKPVKRTKADHGPRSHQPKPVNEGAISQPSKGTKRELEEALPIRNSDKEESHKEVKRAKASVNEPQDEPPCNGGRADHSDNPVSLQGTTSRAD